MTNPSDPGLRLPAEAVRRSRSPVQIQVELKDGFSRRELARRAAELEVEPAVLASHYLSETLREPDERAMLKSSLGVLHGEVRTMRQDFVFALEALLTAAGKTGTEEARKWIAANFKAD